MECPLLEIKTSYSHLSFFVWPLCCLSFEIRILITHLVSSNSSYTLIYFQINDKRSFT